ncbi:MAG TPA: DUF86 domain-containing protein [Methanocorpusculum sp.]|nr:DUF86 domain-containing protein [Methanocorpusculum sp.]
MSSVKDPKVFLHHIQDECGFIIETMSKLSLDEFLSNRLVQGSMRNSVMIIGDAVARLSAEFQSEHAEIPWQQIKDTRNRYIHGYFSIDLMRMWTLLTDDIPALKPKIDTLLQSLE